MVDQDVAVVSRRIRVQRSHCVYVKGVVGADAPDRGNQVDRAAHDIRCAIIVPAVNVAGRVQRDVTGPRVDQPDRHIADVVDQDIAVIAGHGVRVQLRGGVYVKDAVGADAPDRGNQVDPGAHNVCCVVVGRAVNVAGRGKRHIAAAGVDQPDRRIREMLDAYGAAISRRVRVQLCRGVHFQDHAGADAAIVGGQVHRPADDVRYTVVASAVDVTGGIQRNITAARVYGAHRDISREEIQRKSHIIVSGEHTVQHEGRPGVDINVVGTREVDVQILVAGV